MVNYHWYLLWGLGVGLASGFLGLGGGVVAIPSLVLLFGLSQTQAQGTSVAMMVPPIGLWAAYEYYRRGNVVMPVAVCGALGFFVGAWLGAGWANAIDPLLLRRIFAVVLILLGIRMLVV